MMMVIWSCCAVGLVTLAFGGSVGLLWRWYWSVVWFSPVVWLVADVA